MWMLGLSLPLANYLSLYPWILLLLLLSAYYSFQYLHLCKKVRIPVQTRLATFGQKNVEAMSGIFGCGGRLAIHELCMSACVTTDVKYAYMFLYTRLSFGQRHFFSTSVWSGVPSEIDQAREHKGGPVQPLYNDDKQAFKNQSRKHVVCLASRVNVKGCKMLNSQLHSQKHTVSLLSHRCLVTPASTLAVSWTGMR